MTQAGHIVLFPLPPTDFEKSKFRPALLPCKLPGECDDYPLCRSSTRKTEHVPGFDAIVAEGESEMATGGLKVASMMRVGRLAVVNADVLRGAIGHIAPGRRSPATLPDRQMTNLAAAIRALLCGKLTLVRTATKQVAAPAAPAIATGQDALMVECLFEAAFSLK